MIRRDIIHPRERFSCIIPALGFKVAKFELADSNVMKTSFSKPALQQLKSHSIDVF